MQSYMYPKDLFLNNLKAELQFVALRYLLVLGPVYKEVG